jgi:hypothetical protein
VCQHTKQKENYKTKSTKNTTSLKVADKNDTADITVITQSRGVSKKTTGIEVRKIKQLDEKMGVYGFLGFRES